MEPEIIESSVTPTKGSDEKKSSKAMEAEKFGGLPCIALTTFNLPTDVIARLEQNKLIPKPQGTIKTIEDLDTGDVIDCVDFWQQPAFINNPKAIEDYKKHYGDTYHPTSNIPKMENPSHSPRGFIQTWHKFGECPEGTVPILRMRPSTGLCRTGSPFGSRYDKKE